MPRNSELEQEFGYDPIPDRPAHITVIQVRTEADADAMDWLENNAGHRDAVFVPEQNKAITISPETQGSWENYWSAGSDLNLDGAHLWIVSEENLVPAPDEIRILALHEGKTTVARIERATRR